LKITDGGDAIAEDFTAWLEAAADGRLDLGGLVTRIRRSRTRPWSRRSGRWGPAR
jgi:hypothetical protein